MPVNETGRVLIHREWGNQVIMPNQWYEGREIGVDGFYLPEQRAAAAPVPAETPAPDPPAAVDAAPPAGSSPTEEPSPEQVAAPSPVPAPAPAPAEPAEEIDAEFERLAALSWNELKKMIDKRRLKPGPGRPKKEVLAAAVLAHDRAGGGGKR